MHDARNDSSPSLDQTLTALLARRAHEGDVEQFRELYERVAPALYGWAALKLGPGLRGRLDAEEIAQETWLRALRSIREFDAARASFRAWLFGIARRVLLEAFQTLRRQPGAGAGTSVRVFAIENHPDTVTSATRRIAREDALVHFIARVGELGEDEQMLTLLCGLEGLSYEDAAERLGISRDAVKKRWSRLRAELVARQLPRDLLVETA
jgi:RNA polymerase sigma-70 factor (ECF subfamily)